MAKVTASASRNRLNIVELTSDCSAAVQVLSNSWLTLVIKLIQWLILCQLIHHNHEGCHLKYSCCQRKSLSVNQSIITMIKNICVHLCVIMSLIWQKSTASNCTFKLCRHIVSFWDINCKHQFKSSNVWCATACHLGNRYSKHKCSYRNLPIYI